jgi:hypothetical protein
MGLDWHRASDKAALDGVKRRGARGAGPQKKKASMSAGLRVGFQCVSLAGGKAKFMCCL